MKHFSSHCGSLREPAILNGEQSEIGCPQSPMKDELKSKKYNLNMTTRTLKSFQTT